MAVDLIKKNPATTVAVGVATGIFVRVQSSEKPVAARIAELIRGARGAPEGARRAASAAGDCARGEDPPVHGRVPALTFRGDGSTHARGRRRRRAR